MKRISLLLLVVCICFAVAAWPQTQLQEKGTFVFSAPGAGTGADQGTWPQAISTAGVVGYYVDASYVSHGFLLSPDRSITVFDAPDAGTGANQGTWAYAINKNGVITGTYQDNNFVYHGFKRIPDGTIREFDVPRSDGTYPTTINDGGVIGGYFTHRGNILPFLRYRDGTINKFSCTWTSYQWWIRSINAEGAATGGGVFRRRRQMGEMEFAFLYTPDGTVITFEAPDVWQHRHVGTLGESINAAGVISGSFTGKYGVTRGFERMPDGTITEFWPRDTGKAPPEGAWADGINSAGEIVGNYQDDFLVWHSFERMPDGAITEIDVPGYQNSKLFDINPTMPNYVTGITWNSDGVMYGFVAK